MQHKEAAKRGNRWSLLDRKDDAKVTLKEGKTGSTQLNINAKVIHHTILGFTKFDLPKFISAGFNCSSLFAYSHTCLVQND